MLSRLLPRSFSFSKFLYLFNKRHYYVQGALEPFSPIPNKEPEYASHMSDVFSNIKDDSNIFIQGAAATPSVLLIELKDFVLDRGLKNVCLYHIHTDGPYPFAEKECIGHFRTNSLFTGPNCRQSVNQGLSDYTPIFLSEIPSLFRRKVIQLDMALISVTPADKHGFCSLGPSVDITRAAIQNATRIVAQVNPNLPLTRGDASIHRSHLDYLVHASMPLHQLNPSTPSEEETKIARLISEHLVKDGATLQMGIGSIPDAVLNELKHHRHLGVHTEMFSDGLVNLVEVGSVTNALKKFRPGKIVSSFCMGTSKTFNFIDNNPLVELCDIAWVNSPIIIAQNPRPTAINSCIEIDLTGQVCSDSIGTRIYSGVGGQVDFIRGAAISVDGEGKPILALCSTTSKGASKIVPYLKQGAGVVTTRAHVHYIVTEFGIAELFGKNLRQRAYSLIQISHPNHREDLEKSAFDILKCMPSPE